MKRFSSVFLRILWGLFFLFCIVVLAHAQNPAPTPPVQWGTVVAGIINLLVTMVVVQALKSWIPKINAQLPWLLPIIAGAVGPGLATLQNLISAWFGAPIDLSPVVAIFTGGSAVALHQVYRQGIKQHLLLRMSRPGQMPK